MISTTVERIPRHTPDYANQHIENEIEGNVAR
jgi:hypothetical protein